MISVYKQSGISLEFCVLCFMVILIFEGLDSKMIDRYPKPVNLPNSKYSNEPTDIKANIFTTFLHDVWNPIEMS